MPQPSEFKYDLFLSHSAKDKAGVRFASLSASTWTKRTNRPSGRHSKSKAR